MPAADQAGEDETVLAHLGTPGQSPVEDALDALPQLLADDWLIGPSVGLTTPVEIARVEAATEHLVDARRGDRIPALAEREAGLAAHPGDLLDGVLPGHVPLEKLRHQGGSLRVGDDGALAVTALDVDVADGRVGPPAALLGLLHLAFTHFLGEVVDVVLGHQHLDAMHELLRGPRVGGEDDVLLDEMNLEVELVDLDPVLEVAVQPIRFLHQHGPAGRVLAQDGEHGAKARPSRLLCGLDVGELLEDAEVLFGGVGANELAPAASARRAETQDRLQPRSCPEAAALTSLGWSSCGPPVRG